MLQQQPGKVRKGKGKIKTNKEGWRKELLGGKNERRMDEKRKQEVGRKDRRNKGWRKEALRKLFVNKSVLTRRISNVWTSPLNPLTHTCGACRAQTGVWSSLWRLCILIMYVVSGIMLQKALERSQLPVGESSGVVFHLHVSVSLSCLFLTCADTNLTLEPTLSLFPVMTERSKNQPWGLVSWTVAAEGFRIQV